MMVWVVDHNQLDHPRVHSALSQSTISNRCLLVKATANMLLLAGHTVTFHTMSWHLMERHVCSHTTCFFREYQTTDTLFNTFQHVLGNMRVTPPICHRLYLVHSYYLLEHRYPTDGELAAFLRLRIEFDNDILTATSEPITSEGVADMDLIPVSLAETETSCAICQDSIQIGQKEYTLRCLHSFHSDPEECIGTSILEWFNNHRTCPVCRVEV